MTQKILMPNNFSHFLIPATLLSMLISILIVVVIITTTNSALFPVISHSQISPSDHFPIFCKLSVQPPSPPPPPLQHISFRCIDAIHIPHFVRDIFSSRLIHNPPSSLSDLVDCYNFTLSSLLNKHAPLKTKTVHSRPSKSWFTSQLYAQKTSCRQLQRIWARTNSVFDLKRLRYATNKTVSGCSH